MSHDCQECRARLPWFAGGELAVDDADAVRAHLMACPACRAEASGLLRSVQTLRAQAAGRPDPGDAFFAQLHADVMAAVDREPVPAGRHRTPWLWVGAAMAAGLLASLCFWAVSGPQARGLLDRAPIQVQGGEPVTGDEPPRIVSLGHEVPGGRDRGMRARLDLRTLDYWEVPPAAQRHPGAQADAVQAAERAALVGAQVGHAGR